MKKLKRKGLIIVVSAPSGCGKSTLCDKILDIDKNIKLSISITTRQLRRGEQDKKEYKFVSVDKFKKMIKDNKFLEYEKILGNYYGTPKKFIDDRIKNGKDILLNIDVKGGVKLKNKVSDAVLIFIMPPSVKALRERLQKRSQDSAKEINQRLLLAKKELEWYKKYDYVVINDNINEAVEKLRAIVIAERLKL